MNVPRGNGVERRTFGRVGISDDILSVSSVQNTTQVTDSTNCSQAVAAKPNVVFDVLGCGAKQPRTAAMAVAAIQDKIP